jgi:hypothetical protein
MVDALDFMRQAALRKRVNGVAGGNRIVWQEKDLIKLHDRYMAARPEEFSCDDSTVLKYSGAASPDKAALAKLGIELRDFAPDDNAFLCLATNETVDHAGDSVKLPGIDSCVFEKNGAVLDSHDSSKPPVASSGRPFMSGNNLLAIARFPKPGVSANSDQIAAAVRARLMRGISIGFIPQSWSFSKDPSRKMGVDFHAIKLLEFSMCSIPMNPDCRVLGSVASSQSAPSTSDAKAADRRREARVIAAKARTLIASISDAVPPTREKRMAEARALVRTVRGEM